MSCVAVNPASGEAVGEIPDWDEHYLQEALTQVAAATPISGPACK